MAVVYGRYAEACFGIAFRILRDRQLAQDAVQETFTALWRAPQRYDPARGELEAWLLAVAHNRSVDIVRQHRQCQPYDIEATFATTACEMNAPDDQAFAATEASQLRAALEALDERWRRVILLAYYGGHTQAEIASLTGLPLGTVKSRTAYALRKLRAALPSLEVEVAAPA